MGKEVEDVGWRITDLMGNMIGCSMWYVGSGGTPTADPEIEEYIGKDDSEGLESYPFICLICEI